MLLNDLLVQPSGLKVAQEMASALEGLGQYLYVLLLAGAGWEQLLSHRS